MEHHTCDGARAVPIPGHPELRIITRNPVRYTEALLRSLGAQLAAWLAARGAAEDAPAPAPIDEEAAKAMLRALGEPEALAALAGLPPARGPELADWLALAVALLERPASERPPDVRGSLLRLRYIEGLPSKDVRQRLHLSERHYYRLQSAGLAWLAEQLRRHLGR